MKQKLREILFHVLTKAAQLSPLMCSLQQRVQFRDQTLPGDANVEVPDIEDYHVTYGITMTRDDLPLALNALPIDKASGPDDINNRVLKELADQQTTPLGPPFNQSIHDGWVRKSGRWFT